MKSLSKALIATSLPVFFLCSCKKNYKCACIQTNSAGTQELVYEEDRITHRSAEKWCNSFEISNSLAYGTIVCELE